MHYLIRLNRSFVLGLCICGIFSYSLVAQSSDPSFDLDRYEFEPGIPEQVDIRLTVRITQANTVAIDNPFPFGAMAIELVRKITPGNTSDFWLTSDSVLFSKNIPQTVWVDAQKRKIIIHTVDALKTGEQLMIRMRISLDENDHVREPKSSAGKPIQTSEKRMTLSLSHSSTPRTALKYMSAKPIVIKRLGSEK